jgi:hypothetical protein
MLKKIIFIVAGVTIAVGTYGFMHVEKNTPQPVKAMAMVDWSMGNSLSVVPHFAPGQIVELTWSNLTDVTFKEMYVQDIDSYYWKPTFGPSVKAMEGKEVYITGYVIPVDYDENFYVVSRYPYANCYFCGGGGPESVVDLRFSGKNRTYKTDERLTFRGKLKLNATDIYQMNYILEGATEYKP